MDTEIRIAQVDDAAAIAHIKQAIWNEKTSVEHLTGVIRDDNHITQLALLDGEVVGFVDGFMTQTADGQPRWELDLLAVLPESQRQGIGRELIKQNVQYGQERGAAFSRALIAVYNTGSQKVFEHAGYTAEPELHMLYVSKSETDKTTSAPDDAHLIQVNTLNYRGVWLEGNITPEGILAGLTFRQQQRLELVGAVIPLSARDALRAVQNARFEGVGDYRWWILSL